jgi:hypothetical protein
MSSSDDSVTPVIRTMFTPEPRTPEEHHTILMDAMEREIDRFGPASLADMVAALFLCRETESETPDLMWRAYRRVFEQASEACVAVTRQHAKKDGGK